MWRSTMSAAVNTTEVLWSKTDTVNPVFQVAVYMAKRDFVDHCDFVDPVGEFRLNLERSGLCRTTGWLIVSSTANKQSVHLQKRLRVS